MDELVRQLRSNIETGHRIEESWQAIGILTSAVQFADWEYAFELVVGTSRKDLAKLSEQEKRRIIKG